MAGMPQAPPNTVRVGLVATLARWKGHATFLEAIARLPAHLPVRAYIVGDAVYQTEGSQYSLDELRELARSLGVADRVGFTGFVHTRRRPFARFRSSCTRARRPSRSGWSSPRPWRAAAPSSSAMPAARRRSSSRAWTRWCMHRATPAISPRRSPRWRGERGTARAARARRPRDGGTIVRSRADGGRARPHLAGDGRRAGGEGLGDGVLDARLLHVYSGNLYGGIEAILVTLARYRALCPGSSQEFALCFDGRLSARARSDSACRCISVGEVRASRPLTMRRARRALATLVGSGRFDRVVCHAPWSLALFGGVVRRAGVPLVFWAHDAMTGAALDRAAARADEPDLVICNSRYTADLLSLYRRCRCRRRLCAG